MCMTHDMEIQYRGVCIKRKNHVLPTMAKNRLPDMGTKTVRRNCENKDFFFLICFPMDYRDFSVKSKVIIHCFKQ